MTFLNKNIFIHTFFIISIIANNENRKPLKPAVKETIGAIRETIHGALGVVQFNNDQQNKKEFDNSLKELAVGIANLILVGIHHKQDQDEYRFYKGDLVEYIFSILKEEIQNMSL